MNGAAFIDDDFSAGKYGSLWFMRVGAAAIVLALLLVWRRSSLRGMALVVLLRGREFWFAFGLGLVLQAGFMLGLDFFAEARARDCFKAVLAV